MNCRLQRELHLSEVSSPSVFRDLSPTALSDGIMQCHSGRFPGRRQWLAGCIAFVSSEGPENRKRTFRLSHRPPRSRAFGQQDDLTTGPHRLTVTAVGSMPCAISCRSCRTPIRLA